MKNFALIKKFSSPYKKQIVLGVIFSVLSTIFMLLLPQITQLFIDSVYSFSNIDTGNLGALWYYLIGFFGDLTVSQTVLILSFAFIACLIIKNVSGLGAKQNFFYWASEACGDIRKAGFKKLAFADKKLSVNEVFFNFTNDIGDLYDILYIYFPKMITYPLLIIIATTFSFVINWKVALCFTIFIPIIILIGHLTNKKVLRLFNQSRSGKRDMLKTSEELIYEIREIKAYGNEDWAINKYDRYNIYHSEITKTSNNYINKCNFILNILKIIGFGLAVALASLLCFNGKISIGYFVLLLSYAFTALNTASNLVNNFYKTQVGFIGINHLTNFLNTDFSIKESKKLQAIKPDIEIKRASLVLNGKKIFKNLNLKFDYGKHYALSIPQGAGKTALARLLLRFLQVTSGEIKMDGISYERYDISSLRSQFSYISQEPYIFEGTIAENIAMFDKIDPDRLKKIIKICDLENLIDKFIDKAEHKLTEFGANLPSQEKQKINIARALYRDAPVILIDSAFNKFTNTFERKMMEKIKNLYEDKTIIFLTENIKYPEIFDVVISLQKEEEEK